MVHKQSQNQQKPLYFMNFLTILKDKLQSITCNNRVNNRIQNEWHELGLNIL